jgi:hypothetical protein
MSRTRKHKYGRKLIHKKRTVSRNKIKRKMKMKSRKIKQKFKKSHMRYTKNGMKHRIQRGGNIEEDYKKLITAYTQTGPSQTADNLYDVTAQALTTLNLHHSEGGLHYLRELIHHRRMFSLQNEMYLSLEEVLTIPKLDLTSDTVFFLREQTKGHDVPMKDALEHWLDFIRLAHKILNPFKPLIDQGDIQILELKIGILQDKIKKAKTQNETKLVELYADLITELVAFITKHSKDAPPEPKDFNFFARAATRKVRSAIPPIEIKTFGLEELRNVMVDETYLKEYKGKTVLYIDKVQNHIVKQYLKYRLSDDRTGSKYNTQDTINRFNQRIMFIIMILEGHYEPKKIGLSGYNPDTSEGKKLFLLLSWLNLIPVFGQGDDPYGRHDYVDDSICSKSVSGKDFTKRSFSSFPSVFSSVFSSGKSHCRTCGRCMNTEDTKEEGGYKVCIDCYNLFNPK